MASIVLGQLGSMVGGQFGGAIGGMLGSVIDQRIFNHQNKLPWIDRQVTAATMGLPIPVVYGRCKVGGNLIVSTPLSKKRRGSSSGKGGGGVLGKGNQNTYYVTCGVAICQGPIKNVWRIWADSKLIWSMDPNSETTFVGGLVANGEGGSVQGAIGKGGGKQGSQQNTSNSFGSATFYLGTETQHVDPTMDGIVSGAVPTNENLSGSAAGGPGLCPAFRGMAYVVFTDFDVSQFGNRVPQFQFEVNGFWSGAALQSSGSGNFNVPSPIGACYFDEVQGVYYSMSGSSQVSAFSCLTAGNIFHNDLSNISIKSVYNNVIPNGLTGGVGVSPAVTYTNSMETNDGTFLYPVLFNPDPRPTNTNIPIICEFNATTGFDVAYGFPQMPAGYNFGIPGVSYFCGTPEIYVVADSTVDFNPHPIVALDYTVGPPPTLVWAARLDGTTQTIVSKPDPVTGLIRVFQTLNQASHFGAATTMTYSPSRDELLIGDGNSGSLWVLDGPALPELFGEGNMNGWWDTVNYPLNAFPRNGWLSNYDQVNDVYIFFNNIDVVLVKNAIATGFATPPFVARSSWISMFGQQMQSPDFMTQQRPVGSMAFFNTNGNQVEFFSTADLSLLPSQNWAIDPTKAPGVVGGFQKMVYLPLGEGGLAGGYNGFSVYMNTTTGLPLSVVVADVCQRAGISPSQIDVSELTNDIVLGFPIDHEINGRGVLSSLQEIYMFDMVDNGQKFVGRKRSIHAASPAMAIDVLDLGARPASSEPGQNPQPRLTEVRKADLDLPSVLNLKYRTSAGDYYVRTFSHAQATQMVRRNHISTTTQTHISVSTPLVLSPLAALQAAEMTLFQAYVQRTSVTISLPLPYIQLEPGDNITVSWANAEDGNAESDQLVITQVDVGADNTVKVQATTNNLAAYIPHTVTLTTALPGGRDVDNILSIFLGNGQTIGGLTGLKPIVTPGALNVAPLYNVGQRSPQATTLRILETPPLRDQDDSPGFYWAACGVGSSDGWSMALLRSKDGGVSYEQLDVDNSPAAIGWTRTKLGNAGNPVPGVFDQVNTVTVNLIAGTLSSVIPKLAYQNLALVGQEIIAFANAVQNTDGTWTLSMLQRGLFGTDIFMDEHISEDVFALFDLTGPTKTFVGQLADLGQTYDYAGVTTFGSLSNATRLNYSMTGARIRPEAVCHAQITRATNGDATISWVPRRRIGIEWIDGIEPGVDEPVESYSVDIYRSTGRVAESTVADQDDGTGLLDVDIVGTVVDTLSNWTAVTGTVGSQANQDLGIRQIVYPLTQQLADGLVGGGATWDATNPFYTLSNGNTTATRNGVSPGFQLIEGGNGVTGGKFYFEITPVFLASNATQAGITDGTHRFMALAVGTVALNQVNQFTNGGLTASPSCWAIDLNAKLGWERNGPNGAWNNNPLANPATGVGGIPLNSFSGPVFIGFFGQGGEAITTNFGASAFAGAIPAGFSAGWPGPLFPSISAAIYQVSSRVGRGFPRVVQG